MVMYVAMLALLPYQPRPSREEKVYWEMVEAVFSEG